MTTDSNSLLGKTLGTCTLEYLLSQGGMGTVYLARQLRPHRIVAVKVLLAGSVLKKQAQAAFLARFRHEADAIAALDHVHIMPLYEYGELDQMAYLVMPYVTGGTLRQHLLERGALPLHEALPILEQAAEALDYAHERGIIHRDIKPSNMIFHADGRLLLTDFGLAKMLDQTGKALPLADSGQASLEIAQVCSPFHCEQATKAISLLLKPEDAEATRRVSRPMHASFCSSETVIGTPEYLAPERALGQPADRRADIYSLGIVLFQMLTGQVPFAGSSAISTALMHTEDEPPRPSTLLPSLSPEIEAVILRSLAKNPARRYHTAGDFARALRQATRHAAVAPRPSLLQRQPSVALLPKTTIYALPGTTSKRKPLKSQRWSTFGVRNAVLFVFCSLFILGGFFASLTQGTSTPHPVSAHTPQTPIARPTKQRPTASPTAQPTKQSAVSLMSSGPMPLVSVGTRLYMSALLGSGCPGVQGTWSQDSNARVTCDGNSTTLANSLPSTFHYLAGMFLNGLADGSGIPDDYILQVEAMQGSGSQGDFGVLFRNQPDQIGHRHNGTYALLINPNERTWRAAVYDDVSGSPTYFAHGQFTLPASASMTVDIIVQENTFAFYLNGVFLGQATGPANPNYSSGTIGFAVSTSTVALFKNLAIYVLP